MHMINNSDGIINIILYILACLVLLTAVGLLVAAVILPRISFYTVAKRRMLPKPWLAWLPVGDAYILGSISDHLRFVLTGKRPRRRIVLTVTETLYWILLLAAIALLIFLLLGAFIYLIGIIGTIGLMLTNEDARRETGQIFLGSGVMYLLVCVLSVLRRIIRAKPLFDYYRSCKPRMGTVFLMFSILFPVTVPVFTFLCRKDDNGIPNPEPESLPPEGEDFPE